jgi:hypothetical protein
VSEPVKNKKWIQICYLNLNMLGLSMVIRVYAGARQQAHALW